MQSSFIRNVTALVLATTLWRAGSAQAQEGRPGRVLIFDADGRELVADTPPIMTEDAFNRYIFRETEEVVRKRLDAMLATRIQIVDRACSLSDEQQKKLQLAGHGD